MRTLRPILCVLLLLAIAAAADAPATGSGFAVVVSPDVPINGLSMAELRKLFLGDRQFWNSNLRVSLLIRAPVARERAVIVWTVCRMSEAQFGQHWIGKVMRADTTSSPRQFNSNQAALDLVRSSPGAIAIVNATQVAGMKVLPIDGKMPSDPGYPLQIAR
jgi:hypothetical protein